MVHFLAHFLCLFFSTNFRIEPHFQCSVQYVEKEFENGWVLLLNFPLFSSVESRVSLKTDNQEQKQIKKKYKLQKLLCSILTILKKIVRNQHRNEKYFLHVLSTVTFIKLSWMKCSQWQNCSLNFSLTITSFLTIEKKEGMKRKDENLWETN